MRWLFSRRLARPLPTAKAGEVPAEANERLATPSSSEPTPRYLASGDTALVVEFGSTLDSRLSARVLALDDAVTRAAIPGILETVPTLRSLMVHYDPNVTSHARLTELIAPFCRDEAASHTAPSDGTASRRAFRLPACYDPALALDIADIAAATGLSIDAVIELHASVTYRVYMIGFLPGHPYMGDAPAPLHLPRRKTPRTAVPPGGIGLANGMTSAYPLESPGGWNIVARTPTPLFDLRRTEPVLLRPGDDVKFVPVGQGEFNRLAEAAAAGKWVPEPVEPPP